MGTNKRKIKRLLIAMFVLIMFDQSFGQGSIELAQVNQLIATRDSAVDAKFTEDMNYFLKSGRTSILLSNSDYYRRLGAYSETIREQLFLCYKKCKGSEKNRRVLGLLDLPQYMKDSLLNYKYTELEVRAGLGDTAAQQEIINAYQNFLTLDIKTDKDLNEELYRKKLPEALLVYMGSEEAIKIFLEGLNSTDVFEDTYDQEPYNKISLFYYLLGSYSAFIVDTPPIMSQFYLQKFLYTEEGLLGEDYQAWLRELEKYFEDRHGVKLDIKAPYLIQGYERYMEH